MMLDRSSVPGHCNWLTVLGAAAPYSELSKGEIRHYKSPITIRILRVTYGSGPVFTKILRIIRILRSFLRMAFILRIFLRI